MTDYTLLEPKIILISFFWIIKYVNLLPQIWKIGIKFVTLYILSMTTDYTLITIEFSLFAKIFFCGIHSRLKNKVFGTKFFKDLRLWN